MNEFAGKEESIFSDKSIKSRAVK